MSTFFKNDFYALMDGDNRETVKASHRASWFIEGPEGTLVKAKTSDYKDWGAKSQVRWAVKCTCGFQSDLELGLGARVALHEHRAAAALAAVPGLEEVEAAPAKTKK